MSQLPTYDLKLVEAAQDEDGASLAIIHNNNMLELADYINNIKDVVSGLGAGGGGSISQTTFNQMLQNSKNSVMLLAGMTDGQTIVFNQYQLKRLGYTDPPANSVTFEITDLDTDRSTDFRNFHIMVKKYDGQSVYPVIKSTLTNVKIFFADKSSVATTQQNNSTDPNNKNIILI